ncbi:MAG: hypothetical protein JSW66_18155 [Phycisphaerales bacterium]|nr:MAG: hypothetical protein JSW66_18155 [Phycisphaerales bacterium]
MERARSAVEYLDVLHTTVLNEVSRERPYLIEIAGRDVEDSLGYVQD